jgi:hypothetical protein
MATWADDILCFYKSLSPPSNLPDDITWLLPQKNEEVQFLQQQYYKKYYNNNFKRTLILGINPGRFGAGTTGINFTAPKQLKEFCNISSDFKLTSELSAEFIYEVIQAYGGVEVFCNDFFISSVCPLGLVKGGKNLNYYDSTELKKAVEPFIIKSLKHQLSFNVNRHRCICIGGEKNYRYLSSLNKQFKFFDYIKPLPHPRFIMQYKRKQKQEFIGEYLQALQNK